MSQSNCVSDNSVLNCEGNCPNQLSAPKLIILRKGCWLGGYKVKSVPWEWVSMRRQCALTGSGYQRYRFPFVFKLFYKRKCPVWETTQQETEDQKPALKGSKCPVDQTSTRTVYTSALMLCSERSYHLSKLTWWDSNSWFNVVKRQVSGEAVRSWEAALTNVLSTLTRQLAYVVCPVWHRRRNCLWESRLHQTSTGTLILDFAVSKVVRDNAHRSIMA